MMGTRHIRIASLLLFLLGAAWAAQAEVYKWYDAEGRVQYGNNPPKGVKAKPISGGVTVVPAMKFKKTETASPRELPAPESDKGGRNMSSGRAAEPAGPESAPVRKTQASSSTSKDSTLILPNGQTYKPMPGWSSPPIRPSSASASSPSGAESSSK